jgi:hypothetical protein
MALSVTNLIQGPGVLYTGAFGATEPLDTAVATAPAVAWTDAGGTDGGVKLTVDQKFSALSVDQVVDRAGSRMTGREWMINTNLAEPTLANLSIALNGGTAASGTGYASYDPINTAAAFSPTYIAVLIDGYAPGNVTWRRRVIVRKTLSTAKAELSYQNDKQTFIPVEFTGHYVSSSITPVHVVDQTT